MWERGLSSRMHIGLTGGRLSARPRLRATIIMGVTVLVLTMSPLAHGQTALKTIQPERAETPIGHSFLFLEDPTLTRSPTDVFHALDWGEFSAVPQSSPSLGLSDSAYWFAARVQPRGPRTKAYFLEIGFPQLDHIQLFTRSRGSTQSHPELGDRFPFDARPIPHRHFVFPLELDGNIPTDILLRVASSSPIKVPVTLWERRAFWESDQYSLMGHAGYLGVILVMTLYSLLIYLSASGRVYLYFILSIASLGIVHACLSGLAYQFLWSQSPSWNQLAAPIAASLAILFFALFADACLELPRSHPKLSRILTIIGGTGALLAALGPFIPLRLYSDLVIVSVCALSIFTITAGVLCSLRGDPAAQYHLAGWIALLFGAAHTTLSQRGYDIPRASVEHGLPLGSGMAAVLLSFALGHRINSLEADRQTATKLRAKLRTQITTRLTARVHIFSRIAGDLNNAINKMSQKLKILEDNLLGAGSTIDYLFVGTELSPDAQEAKDKLEHAVNERNTTLGLIRGDFNRVQEIVRNMRGLGTIGGEVVEHTELVHLVNRAIHQLRTNEADFSLDDFVLEYTPPAMGSYAPVLGNSYLIVHALEALFQKAYRGAMVQPSPHVLLEHERFGDQIRLTLKYNGVPMPPEHFEKLFNHTKDPAAKNLAVVRTLLQQQSGDIRLLDAGTQSGWIQFEIILTTATTEFPTVGGDAAHAL